MAPQREEMQLLVHELRSRDQEELETLRRENMQLKMAMQLQGATGATLEERLRAAMLSTVTQTDRTVSPTPQDALDAGAKRSAASVASPPKKPARASDRKPYSVECEAAGLR